MGKPIPMVMTASSKKILDVEVADKRDRDLIPCICVFGSYARENISVTTILSFFLLSPFFFSLFSPFFFLLFFLFFLLSACLLFVGNLAADDVSEHAKPPLPMSVRSCPCGRAHRFRARHGLDTARPHGWQMAGSGGGWIAAPRRRPGHGHGVTIAQGWQCQTRRSRS